MWSVIDQIVRQVIALAISGVLSRLLTPAQFGLMGMVTVAVGFLNVFSDFGFGSSIIQRDNPSKQTLDTMFWTNLILGGVIFLVVMLSADSLAQFFGESQLSLLLIVLGANFIINSFRIVPDALIVKAIDFRSYFFRNLGSVLFSGAIGIIMAYKGWGVWALVAQSLVSSLSGAIISFGMVSWRPSFQYNIGALKADLRFSLPLLGEKSINYWVRNIDNLLIGKVLGTVALGFYSKGYSLMLLPVRQISGTLTRVMFPSFSIIKHDKITVSRQYLNMVCIIAAVSFPLMAGLSIFADSAILLVYGSQWLPVVPIFRILCLLGALQSIGTLCGSIFTSQGKTMLAFNIGLVVKPLMILGIVVGLYVGQVKGVAWAYTFTSFIAFAIESAYVAKVLEISLSRITNCFTKELLATIGAVLTSVAVRRLFAWTDPGNFFEVLLLVTLFLFTYILLSFLLKTQGIQILIRTYARKKVPAYNAGR